MTDDHRSDGRRFGDRHTDSQSSAAHGSDGLMERELRALLHRAVDEVQPDPAALHRIQRAVPRRRARQRNVWTGAAAAVLLTAAAVPAIHGVQHFDLSGGPAPGSALADDDHVGTAGPNGSGATGRPHTPRPANPATAPAGTPAGADTASVSGSLSTGTGGASAGTAPVPGCGRADLGQASSHLAAADGSGKVYGWFTVRNTSGRSCELTGAGTVLVSAASGTDPSKVKVVEHTAGDPAGALPDPAGAPRSLVLAPQAGYQVQFGWVPDAPCAKSAAPSGQSGSAPTAGGQAAGADSRAAETSTVSTAEASASPTGGASPTATPTGEAPSITLAHTPESGGPAVATAVVNGACTGTVYRAAPQEVAAAQPSGAPATGG
ncbi:hypothetical protein GCM10010193_32800 [Kitasatospora atroaurantiaca]|uniref:DUF4232 domain-containing protein n=1 Tax=Kitasatospora atroaurantiaca TaxID=285545 RepID=A0A561ERM3_9ACTN|nr:hypothetical protein [Kitasatospora atroaurantiaca]TWE18262.1 hypothetical protein FB465_3316 [Kitasatospora atroaurantiaca]